MTQKKVAFWRLYLPLLILLSSVFFGIRFVISQGGSGPLFTAGNVPNPGHGADQIACNGCVTSAGIQDGNIGSIDVNTNQICTSLGGAGCPINTGSGIQCTAIASPDIQPSSTNTISISCPVGTTLTGGGCRSNPVMIIDENYPSSSTTWTCQFAQSSTTHKAYAICCT